MKELKSKRVHRIFDAERDHHLAQPEAQAAGNLRKGHNAKTVLTDSGTMSLSVPRDRRGTFQPQLVEKYVRRLPGFDETVIELFASGVSTRRIQPLLEKTSQVAVSPECISKVTDAVMDAYHEGQHRPLKDM